MKSLKLFSIFAGLICLIITSSCDSFVYEDLRPCVVKHRIHFVYDYNLGFEDLFHDEVPSVNLYVFDRNGKLVATESKDVTPGDEEGFYIELTDLPAGNYDLLAWCGVKDSQYFKVNHNNEADPLFAHHTCRIERQVEEGEGVAHIRQDIGRLYHGATLNVDMTQEDGTFDYTMYLRKNTNRVSITLKYLSGKPVNADDYDFVITESNGLMAATNDLMEDDEIKYHPWNQQTLTAEAVETRSDAMNSAVADFTVGRLMAGRNAMLTVTDKEGETIITAPLNDYALLVKDHYYEPGTGREISDQEYLDRQDNYPITFFLDESGTWVKNTLLINSWRIVLNDNDQIH